MVVLRNHTDYALKKPRLRVIRGFETGDQAWLYALREGKMLGNREKVKIALYPRPGFPCDRPLQVGDVAVFPSNRVWASNYRIERILRENFYEALEDWDIEIMRVERYYAGPEMGKVPVQTSGYE